MNRRDLPVPVKKKRKRRKVKRKKPKKWASKRTESAILSNCLHWLKANGVYAWRNNTGASFINGAFIRYGYIGSADVLGLCKSGRFLSIECKSPGGKQSPAQVEFQEKVEENGGLYLLVTSVIQLETWRGEITKKGVVE